MTWIFSPGNKRALSEVKQPRVEFLLVPRGGGEARPRRLGRAGPETQLEIPGDVWKY
jgi:hypothetical protein